MSHISPNLPPSPSPLTTEKLPVSQTAIIQAASLSEPLPLIIARSEPVPRLSSPFDVLVRVLAVALNPNDHKMVAYLPRPGNGVGCDFCGVVAAVGLKPEHNGSNEEGLHSQILDDVPQISVGTRVCGTAFPYAAVAEGDDAHRLGAFAEYIVVDVRQLLRVPGDWTDLQAAVMGGVGWSTVALALSDTAALALEGTPSQPATDSKPVLVYGGSTATGTMACQLLRLSGYRPLAIVQSAESARLATLYGAAATLVVDAANPQANVDSIRRLADAPLRHALDCITDEASAAFCFAAMARTGGRYACLEACPESWRTRRVVKVKEVMGYEILGRNIELGGPESVYTRAQNAAATALGRQWTRTMQQLLDRRALETHPVQELQDASPWMEQVLHGLEILRNGQVRRKKLAVRVAR